MSIYEIALLFLLFITYSFIGWCMEVVCKYIEYKKFINRGFLIGPYCPIYGWGCILITLLLHKYMDDVVALFIMAIVVCSLLEYFTSFFMEKIFKARWWDYSSKKFNINGRICLETMIPFGLLGLLIIYFVNPFLVSVYSLLPKKIVLLLSCFLCLCFLIDNFISYMILYKLKIPNIKVYKDNTEEISLYVRQVLEQKSFLYRRLVHAFPNMQVIKNKWLSYNNDIDQINEY